MASHTVLKEQLLEMGFDENLINGALKLLKDNATLESVIESIDNGTAEVASKSLNEEPNKDTSQTSSNEKTAEDIEAKKKDYADKIKQRRLEIEEKEKEADKQREIQRRKDGKDMGKLRDELKKMQDENFIQNLKREKAENKAARERILRQIEQDKAERKARYSKETIEISPAPIVISSIASKTGKTKLAIRLLDGSQIIQEFDDKEVLSAVRAYIVTQKNIPFNITFAMSPKPPFTEEDMDKSLLVLGLSPNARLQVIKRS